MRSGWSPNERTVKMSVNTRGKNCLIDHYYFPPIKQFIEKKKNNRNIVQVKGLFRLNKFFSGKHLVTSLYHIMNP